MLKRRLCREFKEHPYEISDVTPHTMKITFKHRNNNIIAVIPSDYPFKPPLKLFVNNVELNHRYFYDRPLGVMNELRKNYGMGCCHMCQSFLCTGNWSPSITLNTVVNQMTQFRTNILQAHYNAYIRKSGLLPISDVLVELVLDYL